MEKGAAAAGESRSDFDIWQIGAMDYTEDGNQARDKSARCYVYIAGYIVSDKDLITRGVPRQHRDAMLELRRSYSTRPGAQNIQLVKELGLFEYLSKRVAVCGTADSATNKWLPPRMPALSASYFSASPSIRQKQCGVSARRSCEGQSWPLIDQEGRAPSQAWESSWRRGSASSGRGLQYGSRRTALIVVSMPSRGMPSSRSERGTPSTVARSDQAILRTRAPDSLLHPAEGFRNGIRIV